MLETKLLLVDDEQSFVAALAKRLSIRNVQVVTVYSGEESLTKLDQDPEIDVVLLDVKMPGMDGIAALREIKRAHPIVEVIMLTGHATVESAIEGMKLGAFDYLMKPCDLEELIAKVEGAKSKRRAHQAKILEASGKELRGKRGR
ncbi:MAG TPA: response regulator [Desulfomonilaceae bacterium]|nr:response regulator [Desulfomonilaceae bacterium]